MPDGVIRREQSVKVQACIAAIQPHRAVCRLRPRIEELAKLNEHRHGIPRHGQRRPVKTRIRPARIITRAEHRFQERHGEATKLLASGRRRPQFRPSCNQRFAGGNHFRERTAMLRTLRIADLGVVISREFDRTIVF